MDPAGPLPGSQFLRLSSPLLVVLARLVLEPTLRTQRPTMQFSELGLPDPIVRAASEAGYTDATSIQAEAIPIVNAGHDLVACSQTGTGKTAAFATPLLAKVDLDNKV